MGKHSASDQRLFWYSLLCAMPPWLRPLILPLLIVRSWSQKVDDRNGKARSAGGNAKKSPHTETPSPSSASPAKLVAFPKAKRVKSYAGIASGAVKLQVLDGGPGVAAIMSVAKRLRQAGYEIAYVGASILQYNKTVLYRQVGFARAADEVGDLLHIEIRRPAPRSIDSSIPLTIVVGNDYETLGTGLTVAAETNYESATDRA